MKLITELYEEQEMLVENTKSGKKYFIEGRWMTANEPNKNGRIYPGMVIESALNKYKDEYISANRSMGELGHPAGPSINLDRASHIIESLNMQGNYVNGRARIMDTPMGKIAKNLIDEGVKLGVSTRGLGSLKRLNTGLNEVQNDYWISTVDIVSDPSGPGCFVRGILESKEYRLDDGKLVEVYVDYRKGKLNEQKTLKAFADLMVELTKHS